MEFVILYFAIPLIAIILFGIGVASFFSKAFPNGEDAEVERQWIGKELRLIASDFRNIESWDENDFWNNHDPVKTAFTRLGYPDVEVFQSGFYTNGLKNPTDKHTFKADIYEVERCRQEILNGALYGVIHVQPTIKV